MNITYMDFVCKEIKSYDVGMPIYSRRISESMRDVFNIENKEAAAATAVAIKRIIDGKMVPELRFYQKGIYYRTDLTPFGELGINTEQLIADRYLLPDIGYETGLSLMYRIGLTTQVPRMRVLATNNAKGGMRTDKKLGVMIRPPKVPVTAENKAYLQVLDILEMMDKAPIDSEYPYEMIAEYVREQRLKYGILLAIADSFYNKATVIQLAHTARSGYRTDGLEKGLEIRK